MVGKKGFKILFGQRVLDFHPSPPMPTDLTMQAHEVHGNSWLSQCHHPNLAPPADLSRQGDKWQTRPQQR
jgi:hypothetical protein